MAKYRVICAGSRDYEDSEYIYKVLDYYLQNLPKHDTEIFDGKARGPDTIGGLYAKEKGYGTRDFPANWDEFGKGAGYIRNEEMAKHATHLIAFWDGVSRGTKDMIDRALKHRLRVVIIRLQRIDAPIGDQSNVYHHKFRNGPVFGESEKSKVCDAVSRRLGGEDLTGVTEHLDHQEAA